MQHVQIVNQEPTTPPSDISEPHSMFIKRRNDFERLGKVGLIYATLPLHELLVPWMLHCAAKILSLAMMDLFLCYWDSSQLSTFFQNCLYWKELPHSRSTSRAAYNQWQCRGMKSQALTLTEYNSDGFNTSVAELPVQWTKVLLWPHHIPLPNPLSFLHLPSQVWFPKAFLINFLQCDLHLRVCFLVTQHKTTKKEQILIRLHFS